MTDQQTTERARRRPPFCLVVSQAYHDWLFAFAEYKNTSAARLTRAALRQMAERENYQAPPAR